MARRSEVRYTLSRRQAGTRARLEDHRNLNPLPPPVPRVARLMALALKLQNLHHREKLPYSELARLAGVSRSRITQICNLLHLAPDIQERLLWLTSDEHGRERVNEAALRPLSGIYDWRRQRRTFDTILRREA